MAGLVTTFMTAASIATTGSVHSELGPIVSMLERSGSKNVAVISESDIPDPNDNFFQKVRKYADLTHVFLAAGVDRLNINQAIDFAIDVKTKDLFPGQGAHFSSYIDASAEKAKAYEKDINPTAKDLDKGLIFYHPDIDHEYIASITGWENASMKFMPGTPLDYKAALLLHEQGHEETGDPERNAEHFYVEKYQDLVAAGETLSLDALHAQRGMRILYDMNSNPNASTLEAHSLLGMNNFRWETETERFPDSFTFGQYEQAVSNVKDMLYGAIGAPLETPDTRLHSLDMSFPSMILSDFYKEKIVSAHTKEEQEKIMDEAHLSAEQKSLYFDDIRQRITNLGYNASLQQPELVYNAALQIQPRIEREGSEDEKLFLRRFIDAAQRYQPELFGVQEADRKSNTPASDRGITLASAAPAMAPAPARSNP